MPYLSTLEVWSRQGTIQIHVYLYFYLYLTEIGRWTMVWHSASDHQTLTVFANSGWAKVIVLLFIRWMLMWSDDERHCGGMSANQTCRWQAFCKSPRVGPGSPSSPLSIYFLIFSPFYFSLSFIGFTYFLLLSIPSLSTGIVPLRFQARGRRRRPNLCLVCVLLCNLCCLYSLVKMDLGVLFYLV